MIRKKKSSKKSDLKSFFITKMGELPLSGFFPLFDMLENQILATQNNSISDEKMLQLLEKYKLLDKEGRNLFYVVTRIYSLRHSDSKMFDIPYEGQKLDTKVVKDSKVYEVEFDLRKFPPLLCLMLDKFCTLHLKKLNEDANRNKQENVVSNPLV